MSKKTLALIAGLTLLTLVLVVLALNTGQKAPPIPTPGETPTPSTYQFPTAPANTTMNLSPNPVSMTSNTATVEVMINTSDNLVTGAQFDVVYDPAVLNFGTVRPGTFFQNGLILINEVDREEGRVTYAISQTPAQMNNPKSGTGTVATLTFTRRSTAQTNGTTALTLDRVEVSARNDENKAVGVSVLKSSTGTTVNLSNTASQSGR